MKQFKIFKKKILDLAYKLVLYEFIEFHKTEEHRQGLEPTVELPADVNPPDKIINHL